MQSSVQHKEGLEWVISVSVAADEMKEHVNKKLRETAQRARIDGFRPGKVPVQHIEKLYGESVRAETVEKQLQESLREAITSNKLRPAGTPKINIKENGMHGPLSYEATFEVYPEITLDKLKDIQIKRLKADVSESDIDEALERVRKNFTDWTAVERAAKEDDRVTIDFAGDMESVPEAQRTAKNQQLVLGSNRMIPGFEEQIKGMKIGEEKTITVTFPAEYHEKSLAGKPANFVINLHKVEEPSLPTVDDAFCERLGITEGGVATLRERLREEITAHGARIARDKAKKELLDQLLSKHPVTLPKVFVEQEFNFLRGVRQPQEHDHHHDHDHDHNHNHDHDHDHHHEHTEKDAELKQEAERKVALSLLLGEYVQEHNIKADEQSMFTKAVEIMRSQFGNVSPEMLQYVLKDENQQALIRSFVLEEKAVDQMLADVVQVTEESISFKALTEQQG